MTLTLRESAVDADAERVCTFLLSRIRAAKGARWDQGARAGVLPLAGHTPEAIRIFAERRVCGVPDVVARGLVAWHHGLRPACAVATIPRAVDVLAWQAQGRRVVSLVADEDAQAFGDPRHPDGLAFALHDLCHLEKFVDAEHHQGQVGFFRACLRLVSDPAFVATEASFDDAWRADRDYVFADMNGSAIFLFAALKMKLNMAVRRSFARRAGGVAPVQGRLTEDEHKALAPAQEALFRGLGLPDEILAAAWAISARRDAPEAATNLLKFFMRRGHECGEGERVMVPPR